MNEQLRIELESAISSGAVSESEVRDLIARGYQRQKQSTLERISKSIDEGVSEAEFLAVINKQR